MLTLRRSHVELLPDPNRVIARPFLPGEQSFAGGPTRVELIAGRALDLPDGEVTASLEQVKSRFLGRHPDMEAIWERNFSAASDMFPDLAGVEGERRALVGAYFTQEYAPEGAALLNPSMVPNSEPNDDGRFILSLRAIGEGHISSVEFRSGHVDDAGEVHFDETSPYLRLGTRRPPIYEKRNFRGKLLALNADAALVEMIMERLGDQFSAAELDQALDLVGRGETSEAAVFETVRLTHWLATSNYELAYSGTEPISERVLLPSSPAESRGIEDTRFVRFADDDHSVTYYATYTAYDGFSILPQLIETKDFVTFRFATMNGSRARNKGMALFPRRIDGMYTALGRHDRENLYLLRSKYIRVWDSSELLCEPERDWEVVQIGTAGSPIETSHGWLVLTHAVGPMRTYSLGAILLDLEDPSRMLGRLAEPLLQPGPEERNGYVPNVVYSCGGMVHAGRLIIPYGYSDTAVRVASVAIDELVDAME